MNDKTQNVVIGAFVLAALTLFVWVLAFLHPSLGDAERTLKVRFSNVDKISLGTRVVYAGKAVGEVVAIDMLEESREMGDVDRTGNLYAYELTLQIDSSVKVFSSDQISVYTSGLLGERSVAIVPKKPAKGEEFRDISEEVIFAKGAESIESMIAMVEGIGKQAKEAFGAFADLIKNNDEDLNLTLKSAKRALDSANETLSRANETDFIGTVQSAASNFGDSMATLNTHLKEIKEREIWEKVADVTENVRSITDAINQPERMDAIVKNFHSFSANLKELGERSEESMDNLDLFLENLNVSGENVREMTTDGVVIAKDARSLMSHISSGKGTVGQLAKGDDLYLRLTSVLDKADTLMSDVNHYGVLFHLDKGWQRQRTKRMNELSELETPHQFENYFGGEIDHISTSLSRVSDVLKQAEQTNTHDRLLDNEEFKSIFADLMRKVEGLENRLKIYNQNLIEEQL